MTTARVPLMQARGLRRLRSTRMKEDRSNVCFRHCSLPPEPRRKVTAQWKEFGWRPHVEFVRHQTTRGICGLELGNTSKAMPIPSSAHDLSCSFPILEVNWLRRVPGLIHGAHLPSLGSCWQPLDVSSGAAWPGYVKRTRAFDADERAALCDGPRILRRSRSSSRCGRCRGSRCRRLSSPGCGTRQTERAKRNEPNGTSRAQRAKRNEPSGTGQRNESIETKRGQTKLTRHRHNILRLIQQPRPHRSDVRVRVARPCPRDVEPVPRQRRAEGLA